MTDELNPFEETMKRVLARALTRAVTQAAEHRLLPAALFLELAEAGVTGMLVPEDAGGIGATLPEAVSILRVAGAAAMPGPLLETMLGQSLLARAGLDASEDALTLSFTEAADLPPIGATVWAAPPSFHAVPWGKAAARFIVVAPDGAGSRIAVSRPTDWTVLPGVDAATEPRDILAGKAVPVQVAGLPRAPYEELLRWAAVLRAGQILGAIEWTFTRSVEYAGERRQFGREIAKFQVVQQMLADLAGNVLAASSITEAAAARPSPAMVAAARSRLADAADAAIAIGHQVHGAIGFSREYALNERTRRLMAWRDDYGGVHRWRAALGASFVQETRETFWAALADAGLLRVM